MLKEKIITNLSLISKIKLGEKLCVNGLIFNIVQDTYQNQLVRKIQQESKYHVVSAVTDLYEQIDLYLLVFESDKALFLKYIVDSLQGLETLANTYSDFPDVSNQLRTLLNLVKNKYTLENSSMGSIP